jgi:hypothetical protein
MVGRFDLDRTGLKGRVSRTSGFGEREYVPVPKKYLSPSIPRPATRIASATSTIVTEAVGATWMCRSRPPVHLVRLFSTSVNCVSTIS